VEEIDNSLFNFDDRQKQFVFPSCPWGMISLSNIVLPGFTFAFRSCIVFYGVKNGSPGDGIAEKI
jgi:hypothetical protein